MVFINIISLIHLKFHFYKFLQNFYLFYAWFIYIYIYIYTFLSFPVTFLELSVSKQLSNTRSFRQVDKWTTRQVHINKSIVLSEPIKR